LCTPDSTSIDTHVIKAELNVAASGRGTVRSAQNEAMTAAEQVVLKRERAAGTARELNEIEAAEEARIVVSGDLHNVSIGPRMTYKVGSGAMVGAFAGLQVLQIWTMYKDAKLARYVMAPYLLEDEHGAFSLEKETQLFHATHYYKLYKSGDRAGQEVEISGDEFSALREEAEILWGTTDWKGDWVPGLLRKELPEVPSADRNRA
jgi:hypothetical protein